MLCGGDFNARIGLRSEQLGQEQGDVTDFARVWETQEDQLMDLFQAGDVAVDPPPPPRLSEDASGAGDALAAEAFLQLCSMGGLLVANGRFGPPSARLTNVNQSGASIVDYMCADARLWSSVNSFAVLDETDGTPWRTVSHHRPIVLGLSIPSKLSGPRLESSELPLSPAALALKKWQALADLALQLDDKAERQQAFDQRWTIRWEATNRDTTEAYEAEVEKSAERLDVAEGQEQIDASLCDISRCVWGAAKAAGLARENIPLPPIAFEHASRPIKRPSAWV